jgi:hypothetical protein
MSDREQMAREVLARVLPGGPFAESEKQGIVLAMLAFDQQRADELAKRRSENERLRETIARLAHAEIAEAADFNAQGPEKWADGVREESPWVERAHTLADAILATLSDCSSEVGDG